MTVSSVIRSLALAAAVAAPLAAGTAHADQTRVPAGATASAAWSGAGSRTLLASPSSPQQTFLSASGATGNGGQHN